MLTRQTSQFTTAPSSGASYVDTIDMEEKNALSNPKNMLEHKHTRVLAVTSGKGGVGKSTLCVNLGISLAKDGKKVLLLDGDLGLANINVLMGIIPDHSIYEVICGKRKLKEVVITTNFGLDIIAGANGISQLADINHDQRAVFLHQLGELQGYDFMLIDTGAGIGANVISMALASDEILVVTTPEPTSVTDAYAMIKSIIVHDPHKNIRLLVNRAPSALEAKRVADRLKSISSRFLSASIESLGFVFEENLVQKSVRNQRPLLTVYPGAKSSACIKHISKQLLRHNNGRKPQGLMSFFQNLFGLSEKKEIGTF